MGTKLLYYLIILPISKLPFGILYRLSDLTYWVLYKIIGYRKKVVSDNISKSFPEKSAAEWKQIEKQFYRHLCDVFVEAIKAFSISKQEAEKRMTHTNTELINRHAAKGKQIVLVGGHCGNWELYAVTVGMSVKPKVIALFTPLKNLFMDQKVRNSRSKYGLEMLSIKEIKSKMDKLQDQLYAIIFAIDQSPRKTQKAYWMNFLGQETGVQYGSEKHAKEYNATVIFGHIERVKRGYYEVSYELICENASETPYGFITQTHTKILENKIKEKPYNWLWSHKRWKHQRPADLELHADLKELSV